jgi:hypothetical protein
MFNVTLLDHLRLGFADVVRAHGAHAGTAERMARRSWQIRIAELTLLVATAAVALVAALRTGDTAATLAAALAALALAGYATAVALDFDARILAHRWAAVRLWLIREQYRALLSELTDGAIEIAAARSRRDALMRELHDVYAHAPLIDRHAGRLARQTLSSPEETAPADEEIDRFLPLSLRKGQKPVAAG